MKIISSISGLRATLEEGKFDTLLIYRYITALCEIYPQGLIVIGRDGRPSGEDIENTLVQILNYFGRKYLVCGIIPTPTVQLMVEHTGAVLGISVTASHNPAEWNGLKFINSQGIFFNSTENDILIKTIEKQKIDVVPPEIFTPINRISNNSANEAINVHINKALSSTIGNNPIDLGSIKSRNFKVVVDAINSSGSVIIPKLLEELNCQVHKINCEANGKFVHHPEPLPENLTELAASVARIGADLGIAVDPDADRLVLINEQGKPISEEMTIVLSIWSYLLSSEEPSKISIVVNHSTTQLVEILARKFGAKVFRAPVGEINVVEKMKQVSAQIGGEGSGGVIWSDFHYGRDAIAGIILILNLLAKTNKKISELVAELPKSIIKKVKIEFNGNYELLKEKTISHFSREKCITEDGIKFIGPDYWVQLRKSNTEPILRIIAESTSEFTTNILIDKLFGIIKYL